MAGSPKKRARKKARTLEETAAEPATLCPPAADSSTQAAPPALLLPALYGEVLPPEPDVTRTAEKRAMRKVAQKHAERALEILAAAMEHTDPRISVPAANAILDRAHGKPTPELGDGDTGLLVSIIRFGEGV